MVTLLDMSFRLSNVVIKECKKDISFSVGNRVLNRSLS